MPTYADAIDNLSALIPELFTVPASVPASAQPSVPGPAEAADAGTAVAAAVRRKFSLNEIGLLSAALGNPQNRFPSVLVAGTNGKGSTASTLASIARASGLRVGLYTSPHLERVNERIRIGDQASNIESVDDQTFATLYFRVHDAAQQLVLSGVLPALPSYFELLTALAFLAFAEAPPLGKPVDLAILEVGMGGRLDATNLVDPILSVITDISFDHQEYLGSTLALIAREKAGILRRDGTLVTLPQHPEANQALGEVATELNVRGISATEYMPARYAGAGADPGQPYSVEVMGGPIRVDSPLKGAHQHRNIALAIASAVELAQHHGFPITPESIERGIRETYWPGRLERIARPNEPEFLLDVAHNPAGAWALRAALNAMPQLRSRSELNLVKMDPVRMDPVEMNPPEMDPAEGDPPQWQCLIFACLRDKPLREMTQILFPVFDHVILAPIHSPRANEVADLLAAAQAIGVPSTPAATVEEAIQLATEMARGSNPPARVVISGSLYLVGEARTLLLKAKQEAQS